MLFFINLPVHIQHGYVLSQPSEWVICHFMPLPACAFTCFRDLSDWWRSKRSKISLFPSLSSVTRMKALFAMVLSHLHIFSSDVSVPIIHSVFELGCFFFFFNHCWILRVLWVLQMKSFIRSEKWGTDLLSLTVFCFIFICIFYCTAQTFFHFLKTLLQLCAYMMCARELGGMHAIVSWNWLSPSTIKRVPADASCLLL